MWDVAETVLEGKFIALTLSENLPKTSCRKVETKAKENGK